jgi:hypothetical protein
MAMSASSFLVAELRPGSWAAASMRHGVAAKPATAKPVDLIKPRRERFMAEEYEVAEQSQFRITVWSL